MDKKTEKMISDNDSTQITPTNKIDYSFTTLGNILLESSEHKNDFKKNDQIKFKLKKKVMTGKIIKIGEYGVDVKCNGKYYYCHDYHNGIFEKSNITKNYT